MGSTGGSGCLRLHLLCGLRPLTGGGGESDAWAVLVMAIPETSPKLSDEKGIGMKVVGLGKQIQAG